MNKKSIVAAFVGLLLAGSVSAQDNSKHNDNDETNMPSGMHDVNNSTTIHGLSLHPSVWAISPMQFTENGVGLSLSYEKAIDKAGIIAYNIPVIATFNLANTNNYGQSSHQDAMFYVSPGLKFYPTGCFGKSKYAIGPTLVIGGGQKTTYNDVYDPYNNYYGNTYTTHSKFILGIMISNSLNINPTEHFYLGLDFGFGFTYIHQWDGVNQGMTGLVQGGFKIGYRL